MTSETVCTLFSHISRRNSDMKNNNVITNSAEFGLIPQRDFFDKDIAVEGNTDKYYIIGRGDFVYNPRKSTTAPYGPFNCYQGEEEGIVSPLYTCLKPLYPEMADYLLWYFRSPAWYSYIYHNGAQGGARHDRVGMTNDLMDGIPVNLPCKTEQKKISEFLTLLDKRIAAQQHFVENLKSYKRGVIQGLFSNRVLGNSTYNHWKEYAIKDLFSNIIDKNHPTEDVLTIIQGVGTVPRNSVERRISYDTAYLSTYKRVKQNDFILHLRSFEGGLEIANQDGLVSPAYTILRSKEHLIPSFFYAYFRSYEFISRKLRTTVEGIRDGKSINMDAFWNIKIPCPSLSEQELLSKGLNLTDKMLTAAAQKLSCMQTLKRKLLSDLFI